MTGAWINAKRYGLYRQNTTVDYADRVALRELGKTDGLYAYPVKNHGRFGADTQRVCCLTALALRDAGISYAKGVQLNIGLLATDEHGCAEANRTYFQDYVDGGRTLARANLFIYTLPSSPIAEAAVHFGLLGPLLYLRPDGQDFNTLLRTARRMLDEQQADDRMLVYQLTKDAGRCLVLEPGDQDMPEMNEEFFKRSLNDEN